MSRQLVQAGLELIRGHVAADHRAVIEHDRRGSGESDFLTDRVVLADYRCVAGERLELAVELRQCQGIAPILGTPDVFRGAPGA